MALLFFTPAWSAQPAEKKTGNPPEVTTDAPTASQAIPLAEVAAKANDVSNSINSLQQRSPLAGQIEAIQKESPGFKVNIDLDLEKTRSILQGKPTLSLLQAQQQLWKEKQLKTNAWMKVLTEETRRILAALDRLAGHYRTWSETRDAAAASGASEPVRNQILSVLAAVESAQAPLRLQREELLDVQSSLSFEVSNCDTMLTQIAEAQQTAVGGLFQRDGHRIWDTALWDGSRTSVRVQVSEIASSWLEDIRLYLVDPSRGMPVQLGLFLILGGPLSFRSKTRGKMGR